MQVATAIFSRSAAELKDCPKPSLPEFAFIGRSNVGKSSLINMLFGRKGLAKVSATPGKTRLINHFLVNGEWFLVDLPGYGYAKAGKENKEGFQRIIVDYCTRRETLLCLFVLIDSRLPLQQIDREFLQWCGEKEIPVAVIYTKSDKSGKTVLQSNLRKLEKSLLELWEQLPNTFVTSSASGEGRREVLDFIAYHIRESRHSRI